MTKKYSLKRASKHQNQTCRDVGIVRPELKTTVINMVRTLMGKVDSMQTHMGHVNTDGNLKNQK